MVLSSRRSPREREPLSMSGLARCPWQNQWSQEKGGPSRSLGWGPCTGTASRGTEHLSHLVQGRLAWAAAGLVPSVRLVVARVGAWPTRGQVAMFLLPSPTTPGSNRVTGVYELSLCHVADTGSPGKRLPWALWSGVGWGTVGGQGAPSPGTTWVTSATLPFGGPSPGDSSAHLVPPGVAGGLEDSEGREEGRGGAAETPRDTWLWGPGGGVPPPSGDKPAARDTSDGRPLQGCSGGAGGCWTRPWPTSGARRTWQAGGRGATASSWTTSGSWRS